MKRERGFEDYEAIEPLEPCSDAISLSSQGMSLVSSNNWRYLGRVSKKRLLRLSTGTALAHRTTPSGQATAAL